MSGSATEQLPFRAPTELMELIRATARLHGHSVAEEMRLGLRHYILRVLLHELDSPGGRIAAGADWKDQRDAVVADLEEVWLAATAPPQMLTELAHSRRPVRTA